MLSLRISTPADGERIIRIWSNAVDATHHFLSAEDRAEIGKEVHASLPAMPLVLAVDEADLALGFMVLSESHIDALFVDPPHHGTGVGRRLVEHAAATHPVITVDVNEQNTTALGFYNRLRFVQIGRSSVDNQGRAYPLIHLRRDLIL